MELVCISVYLCICLTFVSLPQVKPERLKNRLTTAEGVYERSNFASDRFPQIYSVGNGKTLGNTNFCSDGGGADEEGAAEDPEDVAELSQLDL